MDIAIVTGASSALGQAISGRLIQLGFRVYGLGGDYKECPLKNVNFKPVACDLADSVAVEKAAKAILEKEKGVYLLVNNAKYFGSHGFGEMSLAEMERVLRINLLCPLVLARTLSGSLSALQGHIISLGATTMETSRGGPVGAAAAGGLKWMGETFFQDLRDYGVKVCQISPEPNRGRDARLTVRRGARMEASLDPEAVAQAVEEVVQNRYGNIVTELVLRPLRLNEPDIEPVVRLPYPEPQPIPYTVPREVIEAEEREEDAAFEAAREKKREQRKERDEKKKASRSASTPPEPTAKDLTEKPPARPAREVTAPESAPMRREESAPAEPANGGDRSRRRRRRKPKPPMTQVGFLKKEPGTTPPPQAPTPEAKPPAPSEAASRPADQAPAASSEDKAPHAVKGARKRPARKAARKTAPARAAAPDETAPVAAKAAKKAAPRKTATAKKVPRKRPAKKAANDGKSS